MRKLTLFSWGYYGWGPSTKQLIKTFKAVEAARGFSPPLFVDVRLSRSVRAPGFRDKAFENQIGKANYQWMKSLGNKAIREGGRMRLLRPQAVNDLRKLAKYASQKKRRIIFFCSCDIRKFHGIFCHRYTVTDLTLKAAKRRGINLEIIEWPGGNPKELKYQVESNILHAILQGTKKWIPLKSRDNIIQFSSLPWYSFIKTTEGRYIFVGPARYRQGWKLPVMGVPKNMRDHKEALKWARMQRTRERLAL